MRVWLIQFLGFFMRNGGGAPAQEAAGHPRRRRMKLEQVKLIQTYVEYVCPFPDASYNSDLQRLALALLLR